MTTITTQTVQPRSSATTRRRINRATIVGGAVLATIVLHLAGSAAGADYVLTNPGSGDGAKLTLFQASAFSAQIGLAGWGVMALLERYTRHAVRIWTVLAAVVLALSFLPLGYMDTTVTTHVMLAILHVAVTAALVPMAWTRRGSVRES